MDIISGIIDIFPTVYGLNQYYFDKLIKKLLMRIPILSTFYVKLLLIIYIFWNLLSLEYVGPVLLLI